MTRAWKLILPALLLAGCTGGEPAKPEAGGGGDAAPAPVTNRIDIPPTVVQNLGITFAKVERRHIEQTLRVPGRFESPPEAHTNYHTMFPGRVTMLVKQYQQIESGTPLFTLEAPLWLEIRDRLASSDGELAALRAEREVIVAERAAAESALALFPERITAHEDQVAAGRSHLARLSESRDNWQARVTELEELQAKGAGRASELADARGALKDAQAGVAEEEEKLAELRGQRVALTGEKQVQEQAVIVFDRQLDATDTRIANAGDAFERALRTAAGALGVAVNQLSEGGAWRTLEQITVNATAAGVINRMHATTGSWVEANMEVMSSLDLSILRFRARGLQADLGKLKDGLLARVVAPLGGSLTDAAPAEGTLQLPAEADPGERVLDLLVWIENPPAWARPGVVAEAEIVWDKTAEPQLALPNRAIVRDGLDRIFFVRDFRDPNKVIRTVSALGKTDGRWTVVETGVMEGSEVVIEGVYELKLTGAGKTEVEGHFHADGTFHAGKHSDDE
jgi:multidrug resistance efflux pump